MPTNLRLLGVNGANLPTKKAQSVRPSDFSIGGIIGRFERKFLKTFEFGNIDDVKDVMGEHNIPGFFGFDMVEGFFRNIAGNEKNVSRFLSPACTFDTGLLNASALTSKCCSAVEGDPSSFSICPNVSPSGT